MLITVHIGDFVFPFVIDTESDTEKVAELIWRVVGDSEWTQATIIQSIFGLWRLISPLVMKNLLKFILIQI